MTEKAVDIYLICRKKKAVLRIFFLLLTFGFELTKQSSKVKQSTNITHLARSKLKKTETSTATDSDSVKETKDERERERAKANTESMRVNEMATTMCETSTRSQL